MDSAKPLFWHQGLFLQPQHFQQLDRFEDARLEPYRQWLTPHFWGVQNLDIKKAALGVRTFGIARGSFLFPDGSFVDLPGNAVVEDRSFQEDWIEGGKPLTVYIGLRKWNADDSNVTVIKKEDPLAGVTTRFVAPADPLETRDLYAGGPVGHVKKMTYVLRVFWETEKDHLGDYVLIPVAQLERQGSTIACRSSFIPPSLTLSASDTLRRILKDTEDLLASRGRQLEEHKVQRGIHSAEFGSRDMVYLLALRSLNRSLPLLRHYAESDSVHPWAVYGLLRQIVGELSCFSERFNVMGVNAEESNAGGLPAYDPLNLGGCFGSAQDRIVEILNEITAGPDHIITLQVADGVYAADVKPLVLDDKNRFYLALTSDEDPKNTLSAMDSLAKLSSKNYLGILNAHALPGIPLKYLASPPQELPRRKNVLYFAIDAHNDQWAGVKKDRTIAFAWDGAPETLHVELMAVSR